MKTISALLLAGATLALAHGEPDLKHEHSGDLFLKPHGNHRCEEGVLHFENSTGTTEKFGGESLYITGRREHDQMQDAAILYLTDIFGNGLLNNRLLADRLAQSGYLVAMPDLFRGDAVPAEALSDPNSTFDLTAWRSRHPQSQIEEIIESAINTVRKDFQISRVAGTGYCFGGKYVARFLAQGRGLDAGFTAHPSATTEEEWGAVAGPISIAFGALDDANTAENRSKIESIFRSGNKTYQTALYADAEHGFAVRTNLTDKKKAFAQESAYFQAVRWFDTWVKDEI